MTPEGRIKNEILSYLSNLSNSLFWPVDSVGIYDPFKKIFRKKNSIYHMRGISDILGIYCHVPIAIEVKSKTGVVSDYQKLFLNKFNLAGGLGFVARSVEDVKLRLNGLNDLKQNQAIKL